MTDPVWDVQVVNRMVRDRLYLTQDAVDRLMREEKELINLCGSEEKDAIVDLARKAKQVQYLGGDATALLAAHDALVEAQVDHAPRLLEVQGQLETARANMKWLDMAQSGLHWACFTDPKFDAVLASLAAKDPSHE